jgi:DNA-binding transcriptional ArsR family regulator
MQEVVKLFHTLADETRLRLLLTLLDHDATVSDLATRLGLPQPRVSSHLALLRAAGLVEQRAVGRQRVYHADAARIRPLFAALPALTAAATPVTEATTMEAPRSAQADRLVRQDALLRHARSCYDHLAGVAGVRLLDELLRREWLVAEPAAERTHYRATPLGEAALHARGVDLATAQRARRRFAYACLDWTERRPHLGGSLAAATLDALTTAGYITREGEGRTLRLLQPLDRWFSG